MGSSLDSDVEESVLKALSYHLNTNPQLFDDSFICKATANLKSLVVSGKTTVNFLISSYDFTIFIGNFIAFKIQNDFPYSVPYLVM